MFLLFDMLLTTSDSGKLFYMPGFSFACEKKGATLVIYVFFLGFYILGFFLQLMFETLAVKLKDF